MLADIQVDRQIVFHFNVARQIVHEAREAFWNVKVCEGRTPGKDVVADEGDVFRYSHACEGFAIRKCLVPQEYYIGGDGDITKHSTRGKGVGANGDHGRWYEDRPEGNAF